MTTEKLKADSFTLHDSFHNEIFAFKSFFTEIKSGRTILLEFDLTFLKIMVQCWRWKSVDWVLAWHSGDPRFDPQNFFKN